MNHRIAILMLMLWAPLAQPAQQTPRGTIEGIVVNSVSGGAIAGVRILPMSSTGSARASNATVESDAEGRFKIQGLEAGIYRLGFSRNGFVRQEYGQRAFPGEGVPLQVRAGASVKDIVVRMIPTASVSGRITDRQRPLSGVQIQLIHVSYDYSGKRLLRASASARTDDRGDYRLSLVTPGRYYLTAGATAGNLIAPGDQTRPRSEPNRLVPQFYPGAGEIQNASALDLQPGAALNGIDWILSDTMSTHTVHGYVVDGVTGQRLATNPSLQYTGLAAEMGFHPPDRTEREGFQFSNVMPGVYVLSASVRDGRINGVDATRGTFEVVHVNGRDIEVVLTIPAAIAVKGRWRVEGRMMTSGSPRVELAVDLPEAPDFHTTEAWLAGDGTFGFQGISPGTYRVSVSGLPAGYYAKEIRYNDADVLGLPLRITPTEEPATLSVVIASELGTVKGAVMDAARASVPGAQVVLVPAKRGRTDLFQSAVAGPDGSFQFADVVPGEYKVFAWEFLAKNAYFDPEILSLAEESGSVVSVQAAANPPLTVRVIPGKK